MRKGAVCEEPGDVAGTKCPAPVDGAPQQIKIGNVTVNVAVMGQFDLPISSGLWFSWTFDPAVAISWIELAEFDVGEQAVLTITRAADNSTEKILITELRQDLIDRTEAGFNIYRLDAVGNSSFKINTLSIVPPISVPMTEPPAPLSQTAVMEPDGVGGLAIGLIIGGILLCLLALAVVLFVVRRRRSDATTTTINVTPVAAAPTRTSTYSVGLQSQYGAAPATRLAEDMTEQNQYGEAHQVIYGDAPSLGGAYTDPRRGSVPSHYDGVDAPLH